MLTGVEERRTGSRRFDRSRTIEIGAYLSRPLNNIREVQVNRGIDLPSLDERRHVGRHDSDILAKKGTPIILVRPMRSLLQFRDLCVAPRDHP